MKFISKILNLFKNKNTKKNKMIYFSTSKTNKQVFFISNKLKNHCAFVGTTGKGKTFDWEAEQERLNEERKRKHREKMENKLNNF